MDVGSWLEAYRKAWEDKDADAAAALFDEARPTARTSSKNRTRDRTAFGGTGRR